MNKTEIYVIKTLYQCLFIKLPSEKQNIYEHSCTKERGITAFHFPGPIQTKGQQDKPSES